MMRAEGRSDQERASAAKAVVARAFGWERTEEPGQREFIAHDEQGRVLLANKHAEKILGQPMAKMRGTQVAQLLPGISYRMSSDSRQELEYVEPRSQSMRTAAP